MYETILALLVEAVGISTGVVGVTLEVVATICCLFVISVPFLIVYKVITWVCGR